MGGLKNFAAAYATGLLCARRLLQKVGLDELYEGNDDPDGEVVSTEAGKKTYFVEELDDDKRPFKCLLDVGVTTTSASRLRQGGRGVRRRGHGRPHQGRPRVGVHGEAHGRGQRQIPAALSKYIEEGVEPDGLED